MLRRIYNKVGMEHSNLSEEVRLALSVKAMNDTAGPGGYVPSFLVFGTMPRISEVKARSESQEERMKTLLKACAEYETIIASKRVSHAMNMTPAPASSYKFLPGKPVYFYRENWKKWTGPHIVIHIEGKKALVDMGERHGAKSFNIAQPKPAKLPSISEFTKDIPRIAHISPRISTRRTRDANSLELPKE